jgi:hypothetical protein
MLWPMTPDPHYVEMIYRKRQEAFLEEANHERGRRQESRARQTLVERLLFGVGTLLISVGVILYERYAPVMPHGCEVSRTKV